MCVHVGQLINTSLQGAALYTFKLNFNRIYSHPAMCFNINSQFVPFFITESNIMPTINKIWTLTHYSQKRQRNINIYDILSNIFINNWHSRNIFCWNFSLFQARLMYDLMNKFNKIDFVWNGLIGCILGWFCTLFLFGN